METPIPGCRRCNTNRRYLNRHTDWRAGHCPDCIKILTEATENPLNEHLKQKFEDLKERGGAAAKPKSWWKRIWIGLKH